MNNVYEQPKPHPIFESIGKEAQGEPLTIIDGFVYPCEKGPSLFIDL